MFRAFASMFNSFVTFFSAIDRATDFADSWLEQNCDSALKGNLVDIKVAQKAKRKASKLSDKELNAIYSPVKPAIPID